MTFTSSLNGQWKACFYDIEAMHDAIVSMISVRSSKYYFGKYVLPWIALVFMLRCILPFIANELFCFHYREPTPILWIHWINAAVIATLLIWTLFIRHVAQEGRYLVTVCLNAARKNDVHLDVLQMKESVKKIILDASNSMGVVTTVSGMFFTGWWIFFCFVMFNSHYAGHNLAQVGILFFWIPAIYECSNFEEHSGMKELNGIGFTKEGWTEEQIHAYCMSQIRIRGRVIRKVNEKRLRAPGFSLEDALIDLCIYPYIPTKQAVADAALYLHSKNIMLDVEEGEFAETRRIIHDVMDARSNAWWTPARFEMDGAAPTLFEKMCVQHTIRTDE